MITKSLHDSILLGLVPKLLIEARVYGETGHKVLLELVVIHSLAGIDNKGCGVHHHVLKVDFHLVSADGIAPAGVDGLALIVHHIIVLDEVLSYSEVVFLNLFLGILDGA